MGQALVDTRRISESAVVPDWVFQVLWWGAAITGGGAIWYFLDHRNFHVALWTGFASLMMVLLAITLSIRNGLLRSEQAAPRVAPPSVKQGEKTPERGVQLDLARGWTLHRKGETVTVTFMVNTDQLQAALRPEMQRPDVRLEDIANELVPEAQALWTEVTRLVPRPEQPRVPIGPVPAELVEHLNHTFGPRDTRDQDTLNWNYEYLREGTAIKQTAPIRVPVSKLSPAGQKAAKNFDRLAVETVNRWYVEALQRVTKPPRSP